MDNDFLQAMQIFKDSVRDTQTTQSILGANAQVQNIRSSMLKESERNDALRNVAQNLTVNLAGIGANPGQIETAVSGIKPQLKTTALFQTPDQAIMLGTEEDAAKGQAIKDKTYAQQIGLIRAKGEAAREAAGYKSEGKINGQINKSMADFDTKFAKDEIDVLSKVRQFKTLLNSNSPAAFGTAQRLLIKMSGDNRISDADVRAASPDKSVYEQLTRLVQGAAQGTVPTLDRNILRNVGTLLETANRNNLQDKITRYSSSADLVGATPEQLTHRLQMRHFGSAMSPQVSATPHDVQVPGGASNGAAPVPNAVQKFKNGQSAGWFIPVNGGWQKVG